MFTYRSEPLCAWNWKKKSPLWSWERSEDRARQFQLWQQQNAQSKEGDVPGGKGAVGQPPKIAELENQECQRWKMCEQGVTTVTRHQQPGSFPSSLQTKHCNNEANEHPNTWLDIQLPESAPHSSLRDHTPDPAVP